MHTPAVVCELNYAQAVQKILRLDVPMDDILRMNVFEGLADLVDVTSGFLLGIVAVLRRLELFVQLTLGTVFQD